MLLKHKNHDSSVVRCFPVSLRFPSSWPWTGVQIFWKPNTKTEQTEQQSLPTLITISKNVRGNLPGHPRHLRRENFFRWQDFLRWQDFHQMTRFSSDDKTFLRWQDFLQMTRLSSDITQTSNYYTDILLLYRHPTIIQTSKYYTDI